MATNMKKDVWDIEACLIDGKHYYDFFLNDVIVCRVAHQEINCSNELAGYREFLKIASWGAYNFPRRNGDKFEPQFEIYLDEKLFQLIFVANDISVILPRNEANQSLIERVFFKVPVDNDLIDTMLFDVE